MHEHATESTAVAAALSFPFETAPAPGAALEVAPGVRWLRMRLPMAGLNHINLWALEDQGGWTLVDTGMQTADTTADWHKLFADPLSRRPVQRVICTHMHPDHIGMAGWVTRPQHSRPRTKRLGYEA